MIDGVPSMQAGALAQQPSRTLPRWLTVPLIAFLLTRLIVFAAVPLADAVLPHFNDSQIFTSGSAPADFVAAWNRWDSVWYLQIVTEGYTFAPDNPRSTVAFFPLYPLAMSALAPVVGSPLLAGLLISNAAFLAALMLLYRLTSLKTDESTAARTVFYVAAFPLAFVFSAVYTESLFLLLVVAAFYAAERERWGWAALAGILASAARPTGIVLVGALGLMLLAKHGGSLRAALRDPRPALLIALIPLGVVAYAVYLQAAFGSPMVFMAAQSGWRMPIAAMQVFGDIDLMLHGKLWPSYIVDMAVMFGGLLMVVPIGRRFGAGYALFTLVSILIPASSGVMSMTRFALVMFPLFMLLGVWGRRRWLDVTLRIGFLVLLPLTTILFLKWVFLG